MSSTAQSTLGDLDEPWKDEETLRELYEGRTQSEVAEYLKERGHDVTGSTISYWMKKLEVNTSHTSHNEDSQSDEKRKCIRFDECGNKSPGARNVICDECLAEMRKRDSQTR